MTPQERRKRIVSMVRQQGRASVEELARTLSASRETIRRDLSLLASRGLIQKFHGGACLPLGEEPFRVRMTEQAEQKARIARAAVRRVAPGDTLFIDTGSTTIYFAEELAQVGNLTIFTNSTEIARIIAQADNDSQVFLLGGLYNADNRQTVGAVALEQIRALHARYAFLTVGAINARNGAMDFNPDETAIARAMLEQADRLVILADSSKLARAATFQVCGLERIDMPITDDAPPTTLAGALTEARIEVVLA